jgi:hypothetical protein
MKKLLFLLSIALFAALAIEIKHGTTVVWPSAGKLTMRPNLVAGRIGALTKPTPVTVGSHAGYSMPIYATDDEEIYFRDYVPGRWDGASDFTVSVLCCLAAAETADEDFEFILEWENTAIPGTLTTGTTIVTNAVNLVSAAQYAVYKMDFTIDWNLPATDVASSQHMGYRLRRQAVSGGGADEVEGEVIILDVVITYNVDKIYKGL